MSADGKWTVCDDCGHRTAYLDLRWDGEDLICDDCAVGREESARDRAVESRIEQVEEARLEGFEVEP